MTNDEILLLARESGINFAVDSEGGWSGLTDDEISNRYTGKPHPEDDWTIKRTLEILKPFARAIESRTLTNQKAKWYQEGVEAGLRQALDQLPDTTKMIDKVCIKYWVQDTMESGHWATTDSMSKSTAETLLSDEYGNAFPRGEIVEPSMGLIASEWAGLEEPPNSATNVVESENTQAQELYGKTEQLEAEIKRLQELLERQNEKQD